MLICTGIHILQCTLTIKYLRSHPLNTDIKLYGLYPPRVSHQYPWNNCIPRGLSHPRHNPDGPKSRRIVFNLMATNNLDYFMTVLYGDKTLMESSLSFSSFIHKETHVNLLCHPILVSSGHHTLSRYLLSYIFP